MNTQICHNGRFYQEDTPLFTLKNRAFCYGDSLFETIHAQGTNIHFLKDHFNRLLKGMKLLEMEASVNFSAENIEKEIITLINKNKFFSGVRIKLSVYRNDGGLYTPTDNSISYTIETSPLENPGYELNRKGLKIGIYDKMCKNISPISNFKTSNCFPFILAGNYKTKNKLDDCLIINNNNNLIESISSNLFIIKDKIIYTPSLYSGIVAGIMRDKIIHIAVDLSYTVYDECIITEKQLINADEIFLTNAIQGIKWVVAYKDRRYFNTISKIINQGLNKLADIK